MMQMSLQASFEKKKIWDINDSRAKAVNKHILNKIALDNQPFTIVEDPGFISLIAHM